MITAAKHFCIPFGVIDVDVDPVPIDAKDIMAHGSQTAAIPPHSTNVSSQDAAVAFVNVTVLDSEAPARFHSTSTRDTPAAPTPARLVQPDNDVATLSVNRKMNANITLFCVGVFVNVAEGLVVDPLELAVCTRVTRVVRIVDRLLYNVVTVSGLPVLRSLCLACDA